VAGEGALEHDPVHAGGVLTEFGEGVGRAKVQQRGQVIRRQLQVNQHGRPVLLGQHGGQVDRQRARAASPAGPEHGEDPPGLILTAALRRQPPEGGLELGFQLDLVHIVAGPRAQGAEDEF
jgi:hypothetical protein